MVTTSFLLLLIATAVTARKFTNEELSKFPKLFHLDDYERCLARKDGLYCLGVFDLTADIHPHTTYELLKIYSEETDRHYNRTRIHRGYCVSSRCPKDLEPNASQRFENCVNNWARARTLRPSINTLHYCHTHDDLHTEKPRTSAQQLFLQCVYAIFVFNVIGTFYDVFTGDSPCKNKFLAAFSIPANWRRLTVIHEDGDPRITILTPLNCVRVMCLALITYAHSNFFHYTFHILNPEELEDQCQRIDGIYFSNGTAIIQGLVVVSCFLTCYNLLLFSEKKELSLVLLPLCILKRITRIAPVNLLVIGFAATWWTYTRDGPLVSTTIGLESRACQTKFWSQIFYVNNLVDVADYCVLPTWFLAADMHLYIIVCTLTLLMWRRRTFALKLYSFLFILSCLVIYIIVYLKEYQALIFFTTPEYARNIFRESPSFTNFYISSWGSLPSCFLGLLLGHIQFELNERRIKLSEYRWFVYLYHFAFLMVLTWPLTGMFMRDYRRCDLTKNCNAVLSAAYTALDRPIYCVFAGVAMIGVLNVDGFLRSFATWRQWTTLMRLSLPVMLLHWCVNMTIAARPLAYGTSILDMFVDWTATNVITYALAVPITILLEIPMQKFLGYWLINKCFTS